MSRACYCRHTWVVLWAEHGGQWRGMQALRAPGLLLSGTPVLGNEQHFSFKCKHFLFISFALDRTPNQVSFGSKHFMVDCLQQHTTVVLANVGSPNHSVTPSCVVFFTALACVCSCPTCVSTCSQAVSPPHCLSPTTVLCLLRPCCIFTA